MNDSFYTQHQWRTFAHDLFKVFVESGFEVVDEPQVDFALSGFRATYMRQYNLHRPTPMYDGILTSIIQVVGLPFGHQGHKMVILSSPKNLDNGPIPESIKLRVHFDSDGLPQIVHSEPYPKSECNSNNETSINQFADIMKSPSNRQTNIKREMSIPITLVDEFGRDLRVVKKLHNELNKYIKQIIESISPSLIQLPIEMKLEILKQLSVESILKMSQVNSEFRTLIFKQGESLWRHLCYRDFNLQTINRRNHRTWMDLYRETYLLHEIEICRKERALPGLPERPALPPIPYRLQIEWMPEALEMPFYPIEPAAAAAAVELHNNPMLLALEFNPLRRGSSLDSVS